MTIKIIPTLGDKTYKIRYCTHCNTAYMREVDGGSKDYCPACCEYYPSTCQRCGATISIRPFHKQLCDYCLKK